MKRVTVFCGSSPGFDSSYEEQAYALGAALALHGIGVVYGGSKIGLMGAVARGALEHHGEVIGVLPHFMKSKEVAHTNLTELILVQTMHERKMTMHELSDATIALPGGYGTLEELFEMLTWAQLGLHAKPVALLNINGFYNPLLNMVETMVSNGFLKDTHRDTLIIDNNPETLLQKMQHFQPQTTPKWIKTDAE